MTDQNPTGYEPIPAAGVGADRFDEPALFYLTHQALIDEWHGLRSTVVEALNDWFGTTAREAIAAAAQQRGLQLAQVHGPQRFTHVLAYPAEMPIVESRPVVGVGLGWSRDSVNPLSNPPYVCVRRSARPAGWAGANALLDAGGREFRSKESCKGTDNASWPIYSNVPATSTWWQDLDSYLAAIIDLTERYLDGLSNAVAAAAAAAHAAGTAPGGTAEDGDDL